MNLRLILKKETKSEKITKEDTLENKDLDSESKAVKTKKTETKSEKNYQKRKISQKRVLKIII